MKGQADVQDRQLVAQVGRQDRDAFEQLYRQYYGRLSNFVKSLVNRQDLVDEVVDDTMFAVWRSCDSFEGRSTVSTWIFGIAYRQALKAVRRQSHRHEQGADADFLEAVPDANDSNDPSQAAASTELSNHITHAVQTLSPDHQSAINLVAQGYNATEIGQILQCSAATVRTRLFYARKKIKASLATMDSTISHTRTGTHDE